jgi:hypothetical protein
MQRSTEDLMRYLQEVPDERMHWHTDGEWSAHETLWHVVDVERNVYLLRLTRVVMEDQPTLKYYDEKVAHREGYKPDLAAAELLTEFVDSRRQEIELLRAQPDWDRWGLHETLHKRMSLEFLAHQAMRHTWEHMNQIANTQLDYALAHQEG